MTVSPSGSKSSSAVATSVRFNANNTLALTGTNRITLQNGAGFTWLFDEFGRLTMSAQGNVSGGALQLGGGEAHLYSAGAGVFGISNGTLALLELNSTNPDSDQILQMGRLRIDSRTTDTVNFSHRDNTGVTAYALQFGATGFVALNALTGQSGALRGNNVTKLAWSTAGLSFHGATIAAQQTITGAKGGNAALTDLLTKLATIGLIVDSTT